MVGSGFRVQGSYLGCFEDSGESWRENDALLGSSDGHVQEIPLFNLSCVACVTIDGQHSCCMWVYSTELCELLTSLK